MKLKHITLALFLLIGFQLNANTTNKSKSGTKRVLSSNINTANYGNEKKGDASDPNLTKSGEKDCPYRKVDLNNKAWLPQDNKMETKRATGHQ